MPDYRRNRVPGGTFFFTANLLDRRSDLLVTQIDALRDAVRQVRARAPFHIDAWVVLPDHMHCLWTPAQVFCLGRLARWGAAVASCLLVARAADGPHG
jgi:REP element-mobilizing transposase RayT